MAELNSKVITITESDLLRLNVTASQINHIFKTLAEYPITAQNYEILVTDGKQIQFHKFDDTNIPETLGVKTSEDFYVTEDLGGYKQGEKIPSGTKLVEILTEILRNYQPATFPNAGQPQQESDITYPSIDFTVKAKMGNDTFELSEDENTIYEYEVGTSTNFDSWILTVSTDPGKYPWGPDTGVTFKGLTLYYGGNPYIISKDMNKQDMNNAFTSASINLCNTELSNFTIDDDINGKELKFKIESTNSDSNKAALGNDKQTPSKEQNEDADIKIHSDTVVKEKGFKFKGYYNSAYISSSTDYRSGQYFKDLPETFTYDGNLKTLYIAIKTDLGKNIKSITNKRTGMPQPFIIDSTETEIESKDRSKKVKYTIYKISNKLAESIVNEEYQIIYE